MHSSDSGSEYLARWMYTRHKNINMPEILHTELPHKLGASCTGFAQFALVKKKKKHFMKNVNVV